MRHSTWYYDIDWIQPIESKSSNGFFHPDTGEGRVNHLEVDGEGFKAYGEDWLWRNQMKMEGNLSP